jgi:hypothetical protein
MPLRRTIASAGALRLVVGQFESGTGIPACAPIVTSRIPATYTNAVAAAFLFFFKLTHYPAASPVAAAYKSGYARSLLGCGTLAFEEKSCGV